MGKIVLRKKLNWRVFACVSGARVRRAAVVERPNTLRVLEIRGLAWLFLLQVKLWLREGRLLAKPISPPSRAWPHTATKPKVLSGWRIPLKWLVSWVFLASPSLTFQTLDFLSLPFSCTKSLGWLLSFHHALFALVRLVPVFRLCVLLFPSFTIVIPIITHISPHTRTKTVVSSPCLSLILRPSNQQTRLDHSNPLLGASISSILSR